MKQSKNSSLLESFSSIYYICKLLGIYPHDFQAFHEHKELRKSNLGACIVVAVLIIISVFFNLMIFFFQNTTLQAMQNNLNIVITIVLTYIGLVMMIIDQLVAIYNQGKLSQLFDRIQVIDEGMLQQRIRIHNGGLTWLIRLMIVLALSYELTIFGATYSLLIDHSEWTALLWMFTCIPTLYNTLDKIWFLGLLLALRARFAAINVALEAVVEQHEQHERLKRVQASVVGGNDSATLYKSEQNYGIINTEQMFKVDSARKNKVTPIATSENCFGETIKSPLKIRNALNALAYESELLNVPVIEEKFINLCQLHDGICEIAKDLNEMWCYPMLILMAYGFVIFTAQMYFYYCASADQLIPAVFRIAESSVITVIYLSYISGKCISLMFYSWKTSLESKRTGICLHKCGVAADTNEIYEIVNHLSLKLLNHGLNFSACGFFTLDMETLFAVCGGVTSYLIILIQFNMAGQQAKIANSLPAPTTANTTAALAYANHTVASYLYDIFYLGH